MKGDVKYLLRKFCLESTILGLKYFYIYPDRLSRCFWAISLAVILYTACLLTGLLYERFVEMPTRISIENQYEPIVNMPFPAITLCSPNQISLSATEHFKQTLVDGNRSSSRNLEEMMPQMLGLYMLLSNINTDYINHIQQLIDHNRYTSSEVYGMLPQRCDDFLKLCYLKGKVYPNCKNLFKPILTHHGMCCAFNSKFYFNNKKNEIIRDFVSAKVTKTGFMNALTVVTDFNPDDALDDTVLIAGATRVMFSSWNEFPSDDVSNLVYPGVESFHLIRPTYTYCSEDVIALPHSSRKCYFEDEHRLPYFEKYHNSDCDLLCFVKKIEERCQCTMSFLPHVKHRHECNVTSIVCIIRTKLDMNKLYRSDECECPRDCVSYLFKVEPVIGNLNALPYMISKVYGNIVFNRSTTVAHFIFPEPGYVKQKQETVMSLITLSSNLGGIFGLCMGCSVISVLEIFFYIYVAIKNKLQQNIIGVDQPKDVIFLK